MPSWLVATAGGFGEVRYLARGRESMAGGGAEVLMFLLAVLLVVWVLNRLFSRPPDG